MKPITGKVVGYSHTDTFPEITIRLGRLDEDAAIPLNGEAKIEFTEAEDDK